jgi:23S rRNA (cytosine1962-C5)-methyltransferase
MDYELLDSGGGEKLERYGKILMRRPDPAALWEKYLPIAEWQNADASFVRKGTKGVWKLGENVSKEWPITYRGFTFLIKPTSFKHTGLFPEHIDTWNYLEQCVKESQTPVKALNLFGYTGGATLALAKAGAEVCHVDASKTAVAWARTNAELSGIRNAPIRWIVDDCMAFIKREIKRGNRYDIIVMDPPAFGRGPKDELWKIDEVFMKFLSLCTQVLSEKPITVVINGYAEGYSPRTYAQCLSQAMKAYNGTIEKGELFIPASNTTHVLPCGIYARWKAKH